MYAGDTSAPRVESRPANQKRSNEKDFSILDLQTITDHARPVGVKRYTKIEFARKRALMERKEIQSEGGG